eukprot:TRINITY_DN42369_c0_g1_i1.p1 TRINITY_DN42369_c0_g1~~TRINITY_DN42369_c0_g1_i1.p1  ORF type:complete len:328 (-),score=47.81 TRINITY_DN42369_c0_g1_i1:445-1350(-)
MAHKNLAYVCTFVAGIAVGSLPSVLFWRTGNSLNLDLAARSELVPNNCTDSSEHRPKLKSGSLGGNGWKIIFAFPGSQEPLGESGQFHSNLGEDWLVASLLDCKRNGYFVDIAMGEGFRRSSSLALERDFNWKGVCSAADQRVQQHLMGRQCEQVWAAVGPASGALANYSLGVHLESLDEKQHMPSVALQEVLGKVGAPRVIDFLALDLAGGRTQVLHKFPWKKHRFLIITISSPSKDLRSTLKSQGYYFLRYNSGEWRETWIHESIPGRKRVLSSWKNNAAHTQSCVERSGHQWPRMLVH